ncbi:MFS transporter, MHS family, proline/betaine transporter [Burkholderia sp. GAS332]|nr:MFS transporter, MHS family, proline/betaine transporter [Burkholderia sp. GAS332]
MSSSEFTKAALAQAHPVAPKRSSYRAIVATSLGNALEVYDFTVYSFFSAIIGKLFFPAASPNASLLLSLATFGAGFAIRPFGAVLIGLHADRRGRKAALTLTIALMAAGTALIGLIPTYAQIGIAAPILLVVGRLLQGLSAGGEIGVASTFLLESAALRRRCFYVSWQGASQGASALLGAATGAVLAATLSTSELESYGWRIPFLIGLLIGPVGWVIRRQLDETLVVGGEPPRAGRLIAEHGRTVALGALMMMGSTASMYIMIFYMPTYMTTVLHMPRTLAFASVCASSATILVTGPCFGWLGDRMKSRKTLPVISALIALGMIFPTFLVLTQTHNVALILALSVAIAVCMSMGYGAGGALMLEGLPQAFRATGMSVIYSLGVTIFGGSAQFFVTWLIAKTGSPFAPAWYVFASLMVSLVAVMLYPRSREV